MKISLLVLANSYKNHHRCIAGIDLVSGKWIRPLSRKTPGGEVGQDESSMAGDVQPQLLDIVVIDTSPINVEEVDRHSPEDCYLNSTPWRLDRRLDDLLSLRQFVSNEDYLLHSRVDFVRPGYLMQLPFGERRSLELREAKRFEVFVESSNYGSKYKARAKFNFLDEAVTLSITDVPLRDKMNHGLTGDLGSGFVCVSLALPLEAQEGKRYKLAASWIPLNE